MAMTSLELGLRIADARRARGLTQGALARAAEIERTALSKIEHGRRSVSSLELAAIASALGRPVGSLLGSGRSGGRPALSEIRRRRRRILEIAARRGAHDVRVFGSIARGDARADSDLDLLVRIDADRTLLDQSALLVDLQDLLGREVDVVTEDALRGAMRARILREAVPL